MRNSNSLSTRIAGTLSLLVASLALHAGGPAPVPANVTPLLTSPVHDYILHFDPQPGTSDFYPLLLAAFDMNALDDGGLTTLGNPAGYHAGYDFLGFRDPFFSNDRDIFFYDCNAGSGSCDNGLARFAGIYMPAPTYIGSPEITRRRVLGHELFHHVEYASIDAAGISSTTCGGVWPSTVCEGQARAMEDKVYSDLDAASGGFHAEAIDYLQQPDQEIWLASYEAALFWSYLMEQYGDVPFEPGRGVDFLTRWWEVAEAQGASVDQVAATDDTIKDFVASHGVVIAFHNFILANYIKDLDLSNTSLAFRERYSYVDEQLQAGPGLTTVKLEPEIAVVPGSTSPPFAVNRYGAEYRPFDLTGCPVGRILSIDIEPEIAIDPETGPIDSLSGFFGIVLERNGAPIYYYKKRAESFSISTQQPANPYDRALVVTGGRYGALFGDITVSCEQPVPQFNPSFPVASPNDPMTPGPPDTLSMGEQPVHFPNPQEPSRPLADPDPLALELWVGDEPAEIIGLIPDGENHLLKFVFPEQQADGLYDLTIAFGDHESTVADAVRHGPATPQVLVAIDSSTSMLLPVDGNKLDAIRQTVPLLFDLLPDTHAVALIEFFGNGIEPDDDAAVLVPLARLAADQRTALNDAVDRLTSGPGRLTSIGDALRAALDELAANGGAAQPRDLVLISDGPENEGEFWQDLRPDVLAAGLTVHTIALGGRSDQVLLYEIARATGGRYFYVDDAAPTTDVAGLYDALVHLGNELTSQGMFWQQESPLWDTLTIPIEVPEGLAGAGLPLQIAVADTSAPGDASHVVDVRLFQPDGTQVPTRDPGTKTTASVPFHRIINNTIFGGTWRLEVDGDMSSGVQVLVTASSGLGDRPQLDVGLAGALVPGAELTVNALFSDRGGPIGDAELTTTVRRPNGTSHSQAMTPLLLPGAAADARIDPTAWRAALRSTAAGMPTGFPDSADEPERRGSYQVWTTASLAREDESARRIAREDFPLFDDGTNGDGDGDGLPDTFEARHHCLDPSVDDAADDADADLLSASDEFEHGTDPCDPDTDDGGEQDGSETDDGGNPLDPDDDRIGAVDYAYVVKHGFEHEPMIGMFGPRALSIRFGMPRSPGGPLQLVVLRAEQPDARFQQVALIDPTLGYYMDRDLTPGQTYYYQLYALGAAGERGAPSPVFSGTAREDGEPPIGDLLINSGGFHGEDGRVVVECLLYNEIPATTEMRLTVNGVRGPWEPYQPTVMLPSRGVSGSEMLHVAVQYRDADQNLSTTYSQLIELHPNGATGTIRGSVEFGPTKTVPGASALVQVLEPAGIPNALAGVNGSFELDSLPPGDYLLLIGLDGYLPQMVVTSTTAGATEELGTITLLSSDEVVFVDGFEN